MGRAPCCDKANVKKGPWSPEEDAKLKSYIEKHGTGGNWIALPHKIGLRRCGKSCRLRWLNYLRPNIKHGGFTEDEDNLICSLYISIGSRWSIIAAQLPGRTDNDIKNYWNTRLKKKLLGKQRREQQARREIKKGSGDDSFVKYNDFFGLFPPQPPQLSAAPPPLFVGYGIQQPRMIMEQSRNNILVSDQIEGIFSYDDPIFDPEKKVENDANYHHYLPNQHLCKNMTCPKSVGEENQNSQELMDNMVSADQIHQIMQSMMPPGGLAGFDGLLAVETTTTTADSSSWGSSDLTSLVYPSNSIFFESFQQNMQQNTWSFDDERLVTYLEQHQQQQ